jgi:hypothetical protein
MGPSSNPLAARWDCKEGEGGTIFAGWVSNRAEEKDMLDWQRWIKRELVTPNLSAGSSLCLLTDTSLVKGVALLEILSN